MLRIALMCFFSCLLFTCLDGQTRLGLRLGGNLSTLKTHGVCTFGCDVVNQDKVLYRAFQLGLSANHQLGPSLSLDTDLAYSRRGYVVAAYREVYATMDYLSFPITLNARFQEGPVDFLFGLEPGILLSAKNYVEGEGKDAEDQWSALDFGANLGVAYRLSAALRTKFSYYLGIPSVLAGLDRSEDEPERQGSGAALRMRSFQFSLYYYLIGAKQ